MILGLAKNPDRRALQTRKAAAGLFVVLNAYEGDYEYFSNTEPPVSQNEAKTDDPQRDASKPPCDEDSCQD